MKKVIAVAVIIAGALLLRNRAQAAAVAGLTSYLGNMSLPRGIRNNNPGNLIITLYTWLNKVPLSQNTDGTFEQFYTFEHGLRAMLIDITGDINEGKDTIDKLVEEYSATDQEAYKSAVALRSGIDKYETLNSTNFDQMQRLIEAMAWFENGGDYVTPINFTVAWNLV